MAIDSQKFRNILGHYPTGVCVITAVQENNEPVGMTVGSFTSVSLDPPLVGFFPSRNSSSWLKMAGAQRFCVNVLADDQEWVCRRFASKLQDKFEDVGYRLSDAGLPILGNVVAWIDCDLHSVMEAGDHYIVLGEVRELAVERNAKPLIFCQGNYGQFSPVELQL